MNVLFAHINILAGVFCTFTPIWTPLKISRGCP